MDFLLFSREKVPESPKISFFLAVMIWISICLISVFHTRLEILWELEPYELFIFVFQFYYNMDHVVKYQYLWMKEGINNAWMGDSEILRPVRLFVLRPWNKNKSSSPCLILDFMFCYGKTSVRGYFHLLFISQKSNLSI